MGRDAANKMDAESHSDVQQIGDGAEAFSVTVVEAIRLPNGLCCLQWGAAEIHRDICRYCGPWRGSVVRQSRHISIC